MTFFVVLEEIGGWGGSEPSQHVYYYFPTREQAQRYLVACYAARRDDLWRGEIFEVREGTDE